ncbi:MAG TPA: hypothetical protein VGD17_11625 [Chitinophagaceae bacterium]
MDISKEIYKKIIKQHGPVLDLKKKPEILDDILRELRSLESDDYSSYQKKTSAPFNGPWMDSWMANWVVQKDLPPSDLSPKEFNTALRQMVDLKFRDRLSDLQRFIRDHLAEPPDGGTPEPGVPAPAGPSSMFTSIPPDPDEPFSLAARRRPGLFNTGPDPAPEPPDGGPPEPGVPDPPPDPGPDPGALRNNPWVLYWFVSINAPLILDMIDAHMTRRLNELRMQTPR